MTRFKLGSARLGLCLGSFALLAALPGCSRPESNTTDESGSDASTQGASSTDPTVPTEPGTSEPTTTGDATMSGSQTGTTDPVTTTMPDTSVTTGPPPCADLEGQPNNTPCMDASGCGCESGKCFIVPALGGFCGECLGDADCAAVGGGCTVPNPIAKPPVGSTCNMGEAGAGCQDNAVCSTPEASFCGLLLEVPNIIEVSTCGACAVNADCADPTLPNCSPTYDVMNFSGQYVCVADDSVPNNGGCNLTKDPMGAPVGNDACESGFCGEASVMGLVKLGICGECNSNADCVNVGKKTCSKAMVDLGSAELLGSTCS